MNNTERATRPVEHIAGGSAERLPNRIVRGIAVAEWQIALDGELALIDKPCMRLGKKSKNPQSGIQDRLS